MHFRVRKKTVQLVRTTYNPSTKKPHATVVGNMLLDAPLLTEELKKILTNEEIEQTETWIEYNHRITLLEEEHAALTLINALNLANRWFKNHGESEVAHIAAANILPELQSLRKTLKEINPLI